MKQLMMLLFICFSTTAFSQLKDTLEAEKFWADNITNIVSLNKKKIIEQTHFPLSISIMDDSNEDEKLTKVQFEKLLDKYFNQELRDELSKKDILDIDAWVMNGDTTPTYMIVCETDIEDHKSVLFGFLQFNGKWMLEHITFFDEDY